MKKIITILFCVLTSVTYMTNAQTITIKGKMPANIAEDFALMSIEEQESLAKEGYIDAIEDFCRMRLFYTYGVNGDWEIMGITNKTVERVLPYLKAGITSSPICQFMYACILAGNRTIRDSENKCIPETNGYRYTNLAESKKYFKMYLDSNVKYCPFGSATELIGNAFPDLVN